MKLEWDEADPAHFLAPLCGWTVAINGEDCEVVMPTRAGVLVSGDRLIPWDDIERLHIY